MKDGGPPYNLENPLKGLQSGSPTPTAEPTVSDGGAGSPGFMNQNIIKQIDSIISEAETEIAGEQLAGNVVKEEFWKGTLSAATIIKQMLETEPAMELCSSCHGAGHWECECCDGSRGCSCRGQVVEMGRCNVCHGSGYVRADGVGVNQMANCDEIRGLSYLGSGPIRGL